MKIDSVQRWLEAHCERLNEVAGGVVCSQAQNGELQLVAEWPASGSLGASLVPVAKEAARRAKSLVLVPAVVQKDAGHSRAIAVPLRLGDKICGAAVLAVRSHDPAVAKILLEELERVCPSLAESMTTQDASASANISDKFLKIQEIILNGEDLPAAASKLANQLASGYNFDRVGVGVITRGKLNVVAISHGASVDDRQDLVRGIADAMEEAVDQNAIVHFPVGLEEAPRILQAHTRLSTRTGTAFCTVPLTAGEHAIGALSFERKGNTPLPAGDTQLCVQLASVVAPVLELKRQADRSCWSRARDGMGRAWQRRGERGRRVVLGGALLAAVILFLLPVTFHVGAPARVEGAMQRVLAAPMDGFLRHVRVRPGDVVKKGDVLVELADQELLLEKRKWESELARHQNNFSFAMGRSDRAQFAINFARAAEAKAQLDLVEQQLARAQVVAPMDALVIQGDLTQIIGAPV
ncbi:MAG TPA: biotin/lipoyl-binding protein, partial [Burkholderiales bacterium]|nr:biotin/lipoyl-binding protein [Burkholderiales bacterium]